MRGLGHVRWSRNPWGRYPSAIDSFFLKCFMYELTTYIYGNSSHEPLTRGRSFVFSWIIYSSCNSPMLLFLFALWFLFAIILAFMIVLHASGCVLFSVGFKSNMLWSGLLCMLWSFVCSLVCFCVLSVFFCILCASLCSVDCFCGFFLCSLVYFRVFSVFSENVSIVFMCIPWCIF